MGPAAPPLDSVVKERGATAPALDGLDRELATLEMVYSKETERESSDRK